MRVIAGAAKGRRLVAPPGTGTRPTTDRVKEALFSMLQPRLPGVTAVDLFAGAGGLGVEALSRGARHVTFVERDRRALRALRQNLELTGFGERALVVERSVEVTLAGPLRDAPFGLAFLDPPYDTPPAHIGAVLEALVVHLAPGATVTLERGVRDAVPDWPAALQATRERRYGDTVIHIAELDGGTRA